MACRLCICDPEAHTRQEYVCDEGNASRVVEDDHAASASGEYTDTAGKKFNVDWTKLRLIGFRREG